MKFWVVISTIVGLIILTLSRVVLWPLVPVGLYARYGDSEVKKYGFAFMVGIFSDLVTGRILGMTALFFISMLLVIDVLKLKFKNSLKVNLGVVLVFEIVYLVLVNIFRF